MENMWDDGNIYDSDEDNVQESEDLIYYSDEDDKFEFEDQNKRREFVENENLEHKQWAYGMLEYFADKWKQKNIGNPPSNWKEILIKLLDLEQYQSSNPSEDFERFTEDFNDAKDINEIVVLSPSTRSGWFPSARPIGLKGGLGNSTLTQNSHLKLSNNTNEATKNMCFTNSVLQL